MNTKTIAITKELFRNHNDIDIPPFMETEYIRSTNDKTSTGNRAQRRSRSAHARAFRRMTTMISLGAVLVTGGFWLASHMKNPDKPENFNVTVQAAADYMPGGVSLVDIERKAVTPQTSPKDIETMIRRSDLYLQAQEPDKVTTSLDGRTYQPVQAIFIDDPDDRRNYVMNEDMLQLCLLALKDAGFITAQEYEKGINSTASLFTGYQARDIVQGGMARLQAKYNINDGLNGEKIGEKTFGALFTELNNLGPRP